MLKNYQKQCKNQQNFIILLVTFFIASVLKTIVPESETLTYYALQVDSLHVSLAWFTLIVLQECIYFHKRKISLIAVFGVIIVLAFYCRAIGYVLRFGFLDGTVLEPSGHMSIQTLVAILFDVLIQKTKIYQFQVFNIFALYIIVIGTLSRIYIFHTITEGFVGILLGIVFAIPLKHAIKYLKTYRKKE